MPYNTTFFKTDTAQAVCLAGTGTPQTATVSSQSIISQRDVDRKAVSWAKALAQSRLRCSVPSPGGLLQLTPFQVYSTSGPKGGPYPTFQYTLTNIGKDDVNWVFAPDDSWLTSNITSGFLYVGESVLLTLGVDDTSLSAEEQYSTLLRILNVEAGVADVVLGATVDVETAYFFDQYDGPIDYPAFAYVYQDKYYLNQSVSGVNTFKTAPVGTNPASKSCSLSGGDPASGIITTGYSGSVTYALDGTPSGTLSAQVQREGAIGAYDFPGSPGTTANVDALSFDALLVQVGLAGGYAGWSTIGNSSPDGGESYTETRRTLDTNGGFFAGAFGGPYNNVWCSGDTVSVGYSSRVTPEVLAIPIARTGEPARLQRVDSFDTGTRQIIGNLSRVSLTRDVDESRPSATIEYRFLVEPDVGDAYTIIISKDYSTVGGVVADTIEYPIVVAADVYFEGAVLSYVLRARDDFSSYDPGWYETLPAIGTWNAPASFGAPAPNTQAYDEFREYDDGQITTFIAGWGWAGMGTTGSVDGLRAFDDFEGYSVGEISLFAGGVGWAGSGASRAVNYPRAWDDFESYPDGNITTLTFTSSDNEWAGNGSIG